MLYRIPRANLCRIESFRDIQKRNRKSKNFKKEEKVFLKPPCFRVKFTSIYLLFKPFVFNQHEDSIEFQ